MVKSALPGQRIPVVGADGLISQEWFNYFQAEHNRTGGNSYDLIDGTATALVTAQTDILDATAQGLFTATQGSTSSGAVATIELKVRATDVDTFHAASIKLSAMAANLSRVEIAADSISIDGTLLVNGAIVSSHIATGGVATGNIASEAATIHKVVTVNGPITPTAPQVNTWVNLATLPTFTSTGSPIAISGQFMLHNTDVGSPGTHHYGVRLQRNGSTIWPSVAPTYGSDGGSYFNQPIDWVETPGAGSVTYTLDYFPDSVSCDAVNIVLQADEIKK